MRSRLDFDGCAGAQKGQPFCWNATNDCVLILSGKHDESANTRYCRPNQSNTAI
jgi:hypothetical protein